MTNEELVKLYQEGNNKALEELLNANKGLLYKIARKILIITMKNHLDVDDLVQEGYISLIQSARLYDVNAEYKFTTYAFKGISQSMYAFIYGKTSKDKGNSKVNDCTSVNTSIGENIKLEDTLIDQNDLISEVDKQLYIQKLHKDLFIAMKEVNTPKEIKTIKYRYFKNKTYNQIGNLLGVSLQRIRQVEVNALRKLRQPTILSEYRPKTSKIKSKHFDDDLQRLLDSLNQSENQFKRSREHLFCK